MAKDIECDIINENTADTGVTVENVLIKDGFIDVPEGSPTTPDTDYIRISADATTKELIIKADDGISKRLISVPVAVNKSIFFPATYSGSRGSFAVLTIGLSGSGNLSFIIPPDFVALQKLVLVAIVTTPAAGSGKNIDLTSDYAAVGETYTNHSESDTTTTYDFSGKGNKLTEIDISGIFGSIAAGDYCGILIVHNAIGGSLHYLGISLEYT